MAATAVTPATAQGAEVNPEAQARAIRHPPPPAPLPRTGSDGLASSVPPLLLLLPYLVPSSYPRERKKEKSHNSIAFLLLFSLLIKWFMESFQHHLLLYLPSFFLILSILHAQKFHTRSKYLRERSFLPSTPFYTAAREREKVIEID